MKQYARRSEEGNAILLVVIAILLITAFAVTTFMVSTTDVKDTNLLAKQKKALNVLDIGMEQTVAEVLAQQDMATLADPFVGLTNMLGTNLFENETVTVNNQSIGEFTVSVDSTAAYSDTFTMGLNLTVTAYIPSQSDPMAVQKTGTAVIQSKLEPSEVFNYSYFINNWGWFYGNSIITNGNVRSNGQFDGGGYSATVNGYPRYTDLETSPVSHTVAGSLNINPNNSPDNEFTLTMSDGTVYTRDDLHADQTDFSGAATLVHVKPKGNGNQNTLLVDGVAYNVQNSETYDITADSMTVSVYNSSRNPHGKATGKWWIDITASNSTVSENEQGSNTYDLQDNIDDGGIYSGWDIIQAQNMQGSGGNSSNQYDFQDTLDMPNLSDMTPYETLATSESSSISVAGTTLVSAVLGDDAGEKSNLYLEGTVADPIVINGPVVVRGDVIIKGNVSGQGAIYATGNVYIADDVEYVNPPATPIAASTSESDVETWLSDNEDKDALGLFAREHVVIGDYNHAYYSYVNSWMSNADNESKEDSGEDLIPNTILGRDGIASTADDDVLEGDGVWTVDYYQAGDTIPDGFSLGDAIPGTGEDIDGDGVYDGTTNPTALYISDSLEPALWEGMSNTYGSYSDISTSSIEKIEAAIYTNHTCAALVLAWGTDFILNGCLVSRNEAFVYGADSLTINHDARLLGGGDAFGFYLPRTWTDVQVLGWVVSD